MSTLTLSHAPAALSARWAGRCARWVGAVLTSRAANRLGWVLLALLLLQVAAVLTASPALAECKPPGVPNAAGSGMPGFFDAATANPSKTNFYSQYGFSGLRWNNCELGGPIAGNELAGDPIAGIDTIIGNWMLAIATTIAAASTALHKWIGGAGEMLAPMDKLVTDLGSLTRTVLINNWLVVVLLAGVVIALYAVLASNWRRVLGVVSMIGLTIGFIALIDTVPLEIAHGVDGVAAGIQKQSDQAALKAAGITASSDEAIGAMYVDQLIWPSWAAGMTGKTDAKPDPGTVLGENATRGSWENRLYEASSKGWGSQENADQQRKRFADLAGEIKSKDPGAFQALKGQAYNRSANGAIAVLKVAPVALYRLLAEGGVLLTLMVMRFVPIVGIVFAALLVFETTRPMVFKHARSVFSAIIHTIILAFFTSIHVGIIAWLFANVNIAFAVILSLIITVLFMVISKPIALFREMVPGGQWAEDKIRERVHRSRERHDMRSAWKHTERAEHRSEKAERRHERHERHDRVAPMPIPMVSTNGGAGRADGARVANDGRGDRARHAQREYRANDAPYRHEPIVGTRPVPTHTHEPIVGTRPVPTHTREPITGTRPRYETVAAADVRSAPARAARERTPAAEVTRERSSAGVGTVPAPPQRAPQPRVMSPEEARARGFFFPPQRAPQPTTSAPSPSSNPARLSPVMRTGEPRSARVQIFLPPGYDRAGQVSQQSDAANAEVIGR